MFYLYPSEITVRTEPSGGGLTGGVISGNTTGLNGRSRLVLLLHGYANSVDAARTSYGKFVENLQSQFTTARALVGDIFRFYWPGDERWPGISQLSYPFQIANARESGRMLAEYVNILRPSATGVIDLLLVTHSLGGRVALEFLRRLDEFKQIGQLNPNLNFRGLIMMAAAVQVTRVDAGGDLNSAASLMNRRFVLYSSSDTVLHFAFPAGQTATRNLYPGDHEGVFPQAVGRFGNPRGSWMVCQGMYDYEHWDYWPRATTSIPVAQFFEIPAPNTVGTAQIAKNKLPPRNQISIRKISGL